MHYRGDRFGFSFSRYNAGMDEYEWSLRVGWGGHGSEGWASHYRRSVQFVWRSLKNCVEWYADHLGTERGRGVVSQYRICGFRQWPFSMSYYHEPDLWPVQLTNLAVVRDLLLPAARETNPPFDLVVDYNDDSLWFVDGRGGRWPCVNRAEIEDNVYKARFLDRLHAASRGVAERAAIEVDMLALLDQQQSRAMYFGNAPPNAAAAPRTYGLVTIEGRNFYPLTPARDVASLHIVGLGTWMLMQRLQPIDFYQLQQRTRAHGIPAHYCVVGDELMLWPTPDAAFTLRFETHDCDTPLPYRDPSVAQVQLAQTMANSQAIMAREWQRLYGSLNQNEHTSRATASKSIDLLKQWLDPQQLKQFEHTNGFNVIGSKSKKRYRIHFANAPYNVEVEEGRRLCFVPSGGANAPGDVMLAQKIVLETDETGALAVANRRPYR